MEGTSETEFKYYFAGSVRIALREDEAITWLLSDHLSSTSVTVDVTGNLLTSLKYTAFGELRTGTSTTDYQYTGQRNEAARRVGSNFEPTIKCFGYSLFEISKIEAGRSKNRHVRNEKDGTDL